MNTTVPADDEDLAFISDGDEVATAVRPAWKVLVADDDPEVHTVTKLVLQQFSFQDKGLELLHAYSGQEACEMLRQHPDTGVIFLDVVMESHDAGLLAVRRIREDLGNRMVRIILRTGQPGHAPEHDVTINYDINDYKAKAELTAQKLYVTLVAALRSYHDLLTIETTRRGLVKILDAASNMDFRSRSLFASGLLQQLGSLLDIGEQDLLLLRAAESSGDAFIMAASGACEGFAGEPAETVLDSADTALVASVFASGVAHVDDRRSLHRVSLPDFSPVLLYIGGGRHISEAEWVLIQMFCLKIVLAYENFESVEQSRKDQDAEIALLARLTQQADYLSQDYLTHRARLSQDIAQQLEPSGSTPLGEGRLPALLRRATMLADVGNHSMPRELLQRPGPLSEAEHELLRKHTVFGAALIDATLAEVGGGRVMLLARDLALSHHEHFDGSGYPHELRGDQIPLGARVLAVADSYMALTSARPWREAWTHDAAVAHIEQEAGRRFDPQVVKAFLEVAYAYRSA